MKRAVCGVLDKPCTARFVSLLMETKMSNERKEDAHLKGYEGPFFPLALARVQKRFRYKHVRWNVMLFDLVVDMLHSGGARHHPRTSDGYVWIVVISFQFKGVKFKILFPMIHDLPGKSDGTSSDRHVALYSKTVVSDHDLTLAAEIFASDFVISYKDMYSVAILDSKKRNGIPVAE